MSPKRIAWIEALRIFVISRLVILFITAISAFRFPLAGTTFLRNCSFNTSCLLSIWYHFDGIAYVNVASRGYSMPQDTVFFPLWPLLIRLLGTLLGSSIASYHIASLLLANLFFYLALVVFYQLLSEDFEPTIAKNALFYLAFYPYALFFFAGYTESLFLLLCLATFLFLRHERWWLAGLCGFLAALTRSPGVLLAIPFLVIFLQRFWLDMQIIWQQKLRAFFPIVLIPLGVVVFMLYLWGTKGDPFVFSAEEASFWHRHLTFPGISIAIALQALFHPASQELGFLNFLDLTFSLIPLAILVIGWKRLPLHYSLFAAILGIFSLSYPQGTVEPLTAAPRYFMVIFPILVILALWSSKRQDIDRIVICTSLPLFAINTVLFISHYWVA